VIKGTLAACDNSPCAWHTRQPLKLVTRYLARISIVLDSRFNHLRWRKLGQFRSGFAFVWRGLRMANSVADLLRIGQLGFWNWVAVPSTLCTTLCTTLAAPPPARTPTPSRCESASLAPPRIPPRSTRPARLHALGVRLGKSCRKTLEQLFAIVLKTRRSGFDCSHAHPERPFCGG
jgi:hypothetical protein